ncbi:hypothetical protein BN14_11795 [Rhizoctonia solani AG-1 IB]|uniref:Uncharacterized protein n=1 Tax=Thanatephorus cucumeris (strain AG1-IB / isolate 7/3/14) TaxID=1108050 RepID=M5CHC7_THACB|nr:hypothetical protein BN14_11795 [Rhizoctonia solani AG-1 IB]
MNKILETLESDMDDSDGQIDQIMRPLLLQAGISWEDEYASLRALYNATTVGGASSEAVDAAETDAFGVWLLKILLSTTLTSHLTFMDNGTISDDAYEVIRKYQHDYNFTLQDFRVLQTNSTFPQYGQWVTTRKRASDLEILDCLIVGPLDTDRSRADGQVDPGRRSPP